MIRRFTPVFMKERERAEQRFESVPITIRRLSKAAICDWRPAAGAWRVWIVVESLYSMDGEVAPLGDLLGIAHLHDAFMVVDEAHATGVYGEQGRGLTAAYEGRENLLVVHTCGKALGASGALVTATGVLRTINRCRPFIFATARSLLMAVAVRESLLILQGEPERRTVDEAGRVLASGDGCARREKSFEFADPALYRWRESF
ncbi:aminotransferase class I/II-fold pyridoxal phosphate-dependent enzyme [Bradyrhizobium sp. USDA 3650]